jgi:hypothetical protein
MGLVIDHQLLGKTLHRLEIRHDGQYIGEYERSQAADIERKKQEIRCAQDLLLRIYRQHGEFQVRWVGGRKDKVIYVQGMERGVIPKSCWRKPSWVR